MRRTNLAALLVFCGLMISLVSCGFLGELFAKDFGGTIDVATTTKAGTYNVAAGFYVNDVWTIEAGSTFIIAPDAWIDVSSTGKIVAVGTSSKPITFKSGNSVPAKGDWDGIDDAGNGSVYTYCVIEHADEGLDMGGKLSSVSHCEFNANEKGLDLYDAPSITLLSTNSFTGNDYPLIFNGNVDIDNTNSFTSNTHQYAMFDDGDVSSARSWTVTAVPVYINSSFTIYSTLTIGAGVDSLIAPEILIDIDSASGKLIADGTVDAHISFTSGKPTPAAGDWDGFDINGNGSVMDYCEIKHADIGLEMYTVNFTLTNSLLEENTTNIDAGSSGWTEAPGAGNTLN